MCRERFRSTSLARTTRSRAAEVIATLAWGSDRNTHGVPGTQIVNGTTAGPLAGAASGHGGLSPWVVRNTFVAWGADIQGPRRLDAPMSLADVTPTVLSLFGISAPTGAGRGRVLSELITRDGSTARVSRRTMETRVGSYSSTIVISSVSGHDYVDSGSRDAIVPSRAYDSGAEIIRAQVDFTPIGLWFASRLEPISRVNKNTRAGPCFGREGGTWLTCRRRRAVAAIGKSG